jgi:hypothetical protein
MRSAKSGMARCANPEITAPVLEESVFVMIREIMLDPAKLCARLVHANEETRTMERKLERQLKEIDERIRDLGSQKKRILGIGDEAITPSSQRQIFVRLPQARRRIMAQVMQAQVFNFARLDALRKTLNWPRQKETQSPRGP